MKRTDVCTGHGNRGCPCVFHVTRRAANTAHAHRKREALLDHARQNSPSCPRRMGPAACGGRLDPWIDNLGRTRVRCVACVRRLAGICRDCNLPVSGKKGMAIRCETHRAAAMRESMRAHVERNLDAIRTRQREMVRALTPVERARRNELKAIWRKANPDKVRAQKARYIAKYRNKPNSTYAKYHRSYNRRHGAHYDALEHARKAANPSPVPCCRVCQKPTGWKPMPGRLGKPWSTCNTHCWPHQRAERRRSLSRLRYHAKAHPPKVVKIQPPSTVARRGPRLERLCIEPRCTTVVSRRVKRCSRCREQVRLAAVAARARFAGTRGRRTDLERRSAA